MTVPPGDRLRSIVLGGAERYTREEMASAARLKLEDIARLWRAMGFADVGDARAFTDADLSAVLRVASLLERDLVDMEGLTDIARSMGQTTSRLADWEIDTLGRHVVQAGAQADSTETPGPGEDLAELLPELEQLLIYVWRRQLAASVGRLLDHQPTQAGDTDSGGVTEATTATVGFADLVSFTRLSRQLDDTELTAVVQAFESDSADIIHAASARLVKTLGDEVMFVSDGAEQAAAIALNLHRTHNANDDLPQIRVGLATGAVLNRMGDVFGVTVNRASRFTALARPGTTVLDSATAEVLQDTTETAFTVRSLTPRPVRGLGIVRPHALVDPTT